MKWVIRPGPKLPPAEKQVAKPIKPLHNTVKAYPHKLHRELPLGQKVGKSVLSTILQPKLFGVMKHIQSRGEVSMFSYCCPEMPRALLRHAPLSSFLLFSFPFLSLALVWFQEMRWKPERVDGLAIRLKSHCSSRDWSGLCSFRQKEQSATLLIVHRKLLVNAAKQTPTASPCTPPETSSAQGTVKETYGALERNIVERICIWKWPVADTAKCKSEWRECKSAVGWYISNSPTRIKMSVAVIVSNIFGLQ